MFIDAQGQRYWDSQEAMQELSVKQWKFRLLSKEVAKFRIGDHKVYYRVEDIEALKSRPAKVRLVKEASTSHAPAA